MDEADSAMLAVLSASEPDDSAALETVGFGAGTAGLGVRRDIRAVNRAGHE
jgi:hypothetical protein